MASQVYTSHGTEYWDDYELRIGKGTAQVHSISQHVWRDCGKPQNLSG